MKTISYSLLRAVCALVIGLVLVLFPNQAAEYLVITVGVIFLIPSLISIVGYFAWRGERPVHFPLLGIGSLLFGLWLVIMPGFFADLLTYVLGFILVIGGVQQIASLASARNWMRVPAGFYVVPVLILLAGLFALFNPLGARSTALSSSASAAWCMLCRSWSIGSVSRGSGRKHRHRRRNFPTGLRWKTRRLWIDNE